MGFRECKYCGRLFSFVSKDIIEVVHSNMEIEKCVKCPQCHEEIKILSDAECEVGGMLKTCGTCKHDDRSATDSDSPCYLCQRNAYDNRPDKWEG